jgi:hypothetical protein
VFACSKNCGFGKTLSQQQPIDCSLVVHLKGSSKQQICPDYLNLEDVVVITSSNVEQSSAGVHASDNDRGCATHLIPSDASKIRTLIE